MAEQERRITPPTVDNSGKPPAHPYVSGSRIRGRSSSGKARAAWR